MNTELSVLDAMMSPDNVASSVIMLLDQSFGTLRLTRAKGKFGTAGIDLTPGAAEALEQCHKSGVRVGLIVQEHLRSPALQTLKQYLPMVDNITLYGENLPTTITTCAEQLGTHTRQIVFVAADRMARGFATDLGSLAMPHPLIAALVVRGRDPKFVRVSGDRGRLHRVHDVVPYFAEYTEDRRWTLLAVMSRATIIETVRRGLQVQTLPIDLSTEDPLFVQLDQLDEQAIRALYSQKLLFAEKSRVLIAVGPAQPNDSLAMHGPHGHFQFLAPNPELLSTTMAPTNAFRTAQIALGRLPLYKTKISRLPIDRDIHGSILTPCPSTAASFKSDVDRYSGVSNIDSSGPLVSRHIQHPDNVRAVQALLNELNTIGYCAYTHSFMHAGRMIDNVIADLPGTGYFKLDPHLLEKMRQVFLKYPLPDPPDPWVKAVAGLVSNKWLNEQNLGRLSPLELRTVLEDIFQLKPWLPWWLKLCPLAGPGAQLIIVGCHLDSTGARTPGYNSLTDPAPGADDDASGIAATLAIARYLWSWRGKLTHTVRFCFFNAEEQGMVGSNIYAAMLKSVGAPVKAVVCTDMISYNSDAQRIFEVHAGYTDATIRDLSVPLADVIAGWATCLGALAPAQIYKGTSSSGGSDRNYYDGAINRSDHASFHQQGYPAVVVSEDFFINLATEPGADPNPHYHEEADTVIDSAFGSDITCAIAFAVKELAGG